MRKLTKNEAKIISLLEEVDELSKNKDVKLYIYGHAGSRFVVLDSTNKYDDFERKRECFANERVIFESKYMQGDGGDADFRNAT
jgi:tRNA uridine 5-carbamoylmethylation protein Kti12